jgi:cellulose synthase/poly-beta-1,6-N-acetylglucosamine synthase-like glycosyltransferase
MVRSSQRSPGDARTQRAFDGSLALVAAAAAAVGAGAAAAAAFVTAWMDRPSLLDVLYVGICLLVGAISWGTLAWTLCARRPRRSLAARCMTGDHREPAHSLSFTLRGSRDEAMLEARLSRLVRTNYPVCEVLVLVGTDDPAERDVAERVADRHPELVKVIVDGARSDLTTGDTVVSEKAKLRRVGLLALVAAAAFTATWIHIASLLYFLYIAVSLVLGAIAWTTLVWMLHAWRTPSSLVESRLAHDHLEPAHSFSLIVPARHEEAVLEATLSRLVTSDHPDFEVLVVVGADDPATREVAERVAERHSELVKVIVDTSWPKNKPKALNAALPYCTGAITGVFDAEDDVHPALLERVDQCFQRSDADVVQAGVQLMNFRSSWLTVRNVLEYYFWFRSRLHRHAGQRFVPLGGNTVFVRTRVLRAVSGWDSDCLAEDCELGVRLSALGARTAIFYEPELVTREECPPTLGAFARQRTRWNQGYLQTLSKGYWRRLPLRQRALGGYILVTPYLMAIAWVLLPIALATAVAVKAPVPITLISFLPALPMLSMLAVEIAGLGDFCRAYGERASARDYARLVLGLPLYQAVLAFAAARAVAREVRGNRGWEKTAHLGLHLAQPAEEQGERSHAPLRVPSPRAEPRQRAATGTRVLQLHPATRTLAQSRAGSSGTVEMSAGPLSRGPLAAVSEDDLVPEDLEASPEGWKGASGNGRGDWPHALADDLVGAAGGEPLWMRLEGTTGNGSAPLALPGIPPVGLARAGGSGLADVRARVGRVVRSRADLFLQVALLTVIGSVLATNMLHWPDIQFDEGTYVGNAWAVHHGALAPYTYSYGHPPLAWLFIALWTWASGIFGHATYSIDTGRELMLVVSIVSCSLVYTLARRLDMSRPFAVVAVILFALSPVALYFHRAVLLDNVAIAWALAAFVLAATPRRRLWGFAASGACFAAAVLSKETTLILLPALLLAAAQSSDRRTRRYCLTLLGSFLTLVAFAYPLYATLKGELLPGPGHVSLVGYTMVQLFTRKTTGSIFDPQSESHAIVTEWLRLDPWLLAAGLVLSSIALARRSTRALAVAFLIQVVMALRPGYLPNMYVIGLLPFAALVVAGGSEALWRRAQGMTPRVLAWSMRAAIAALALAVVLLVAPRWKDGVHAATTLRLDGPERAAQRWLVHNVSHDKRLIVDDEFWIYLIEHGFDDRPMRGGFFSQTVVSYWPLDYDPAVKQRFPKGWRDFDYLVSTQAVRSTTTLTPTTARALDHSRLVVRFGHGPTRIDVRAIMGAHRATP